MSKRYLDLVEIPDSFMDSLLVKITDDLEFKVKQKDRDPGYELLIDMLKSKALSGRIEHDISLKNAEREIAKTRRSLERQDRSIVGDLDLEDLAGQYIKLRALVEKLKLRVPGIERIENLPLLNIAVQQSLMKKLEFSYEVERDRDAPLYAEMMSFMKEASSVFEPMTERPVLEDGNEDLLLAMKTLADPLTQPIEEVLDSARKALDISPYCLPAYVVLLEEGRLSDREKLALSDQGISFLEEFFGGEYLENFKGRLCENNGEGFNYMLIRSHHARMLMRFENYDAAILSLLQSLDYDTNDELGLRYVLLTAYSQLGNYAAAHELLLRYDSRGDVYLSYGKALIEFMEKGDSKYAQKLLAKARASFSECWDLIQDKELELSPEILKKFRSSAKLSLALEYALENQELWWNLDLTEA